VTHQDECERAIKQYYERTKADIGAVRSAYSDAAHLCDALAKDYIDANRRGNRKPSMAVKEVAYALTRAGNAIFALRDNLPTVREGEK
jgi:hypothetical protein